MDEDIDARARLAAPRRPPRDPSRFTPDLYPDGPALVPASGPAPDAAAAVARLRDAAVADAEARFADPALVARAPDPGVRAGLVALAGTIGEPLLIAFTAGELPVSSLRFGAPASPGRVVGPGHGASTASRVVNDRYRAEHPALFAPSLAHDLLWRAHGAGRIEETVLHAVAAMVHVQRLALAPHLADLRSELARRQHSLALTLLGSREPGSADISLVAPGGTGTIPGGAPQRQSRDFWSVPWGAGDSSDVLAPPHLAPILRGALGPGVTLPEPLRYDESLTACCARPLGREWLSLEAHLRVATALGLIDA